MSEQLKLRTGKRFRKARQGWRRSANQRRWASRARRFGADYWAQVAWMDSPSPTPGRLIPASKHGRGRWRR